MREAGSMGQRNWEQKESIQLSLLGQAVDRKYTWEMYMPSAQEGTVRSDPLSPGTDVLNQ